MSIATEITRLQNAKANLKTAIEAKGVTVSQSATLSDYPALVESIPSGTDNFEAALNNSLTSYSNDSITTIRSYGLAYLTNLTSVSLPNLQTINSYAFYNDANLDFGDSEFPFPRAKGSIGAYAFRYCYGLKGEITLPTAVTSLGNYTFANCYNMTKFTALGAVTSIGAYTFQGATGKIAKVTEIHIPNGTSAIALNQNFGSATAASACQHLEICDVGKAKSISTNTFANCYKLQTLILRYTSVCTLANVSAFLNTPMRGRGGLTGTIYVPSALVETYKTASVWSTLYGYGYVTFAAIEGSEWEL